MKKELIEFFASNLEATECHVALGYLHSDKDKALDRLKGVGADNVVKTYTLEQVKAMIEQSDDSEVAEMADLAQNKLVQTFKKLSLEKMPQVIEQQKEVVEKLQVSLKATDNKVKTEKAISFHTSILEAMQAAFEEKASEAKK